MYVCNIHMLCSPFNPSGPYPVFYFLGHYRLHTSHGLMHSKPNVSPDNPRKPQIDDQLEVSQRNNLIRTELADTQCKVHSQ